ncbi:MAG: PTS sugar transporter subunit IIA [Spirochaetaceae bacterium]|nr:MAG: PTS sugar transporter subunit IIA [Spirochaetaceae bacterium]
MALLDLIKEDVVKVPLESVTKTDVIRELVDVLVKHGKIQDADKACDAIMKRESLGSTGLEKGIAVPHAKTDQVKSLTLAMGVSPKGVDFQAVDGQPSKLFFLMLAAPDQSGPHLEALAEIARVTRSETFCRLLCSATSAREVVGLFQED